MKNDSKRKSKLNMLIYYSSNDDVYSTNSTTLYLYANIHKRLE